jgi:hypothetical protein
VPQAHICFHPSWKELNDHEGPAPGTRVRKLRAKAEAAGVSTAEAEALTARPAELMANYGTHRALLAAQRLETEHPADRKLDIDNP